MGGKGSGGRRPGAGRKKKPTHLRGIDGGAGRRGPAADRDTAAVAAAASLMDAPASLGPGELVIWLEWAPLAHAAGTLTPATLGNFVQLCQAEVDRRELRAQYTIRRDAAGYPLALLVMGSKEELSVRREHRTLSKDIHARMKDFMIAPFGKELAPGDSGAGAIDPLDAFTRKVREPWPESS